MKRKRSKVDEGGAQHNKCRRTLQRCLLSFTDEVLLRTLSFLDVPDLNVIQRYGEPS